MAGKAIKEYVIKITAEAQEAQKQIDQLAESFSKVGIKGKFDLDLKNHTEQMTGSIGSVTAKLGELQRAFEEGVSTKSMSEEISRLSQTMTEAVNGMKESFDGFAKTFEGLSGGAAGTGLSQVFSDFTKEMNEMMSSYKTIMETIKNTTNNALPQDQVNSAIEQQMSGIANAAKQQAENTKKTLSETKKELEAYWNDFIADQYNIIKDIYEGKKKQVKQKNGTIIEQALDEQENIEYYKSRMGDFISKLNKAKNTYGKEFDVRSFLLDTLELNIEPSELNKYYNRLAEELENIITGNADEARKKVADINRRILQGKQGDLDIAGEEDVVVTVGVKVDESSWDDDGKIDQIVREISNNLKTKVQDKIEPIRIPIQFENAAPTKQGEDTNIETVEGQKGLIKTVKLQVETNKEQFKTAIDEAIKNMGEDVPKIPVKIVATMDKESVQTEANKIEDYLENKNEEYGREGIPVSSGSVGNFNIKDIGGIATEGTLQEIKGILSSIATDGLSLSKEAIQRNMPKEAGPLAYTNDENVDVQTTQFMRQLRYGNRSYVLTDEKKALDKQEADDIVSQTFQETRTELLKEFKSALSNKKKGWKAVEKSDLYTASYKDDAGVERALYGGGEAIKVWQGKLKETFDIYAKELQKRIYGETIRDEKGNIVSEGVATAFERRRNDKTKVDWNGHEIEEWQKILLEDNERQRATKLSRNRSEFIKKNKEQLGTLRLQNKGMTMEQAVDKMINDQFDQKANEIIVSSLTDTLSKDIDKIKNEAVKKVRTEVFRDKSILPEKLTDIAFIQPLEGEIKQSEKKVEAIAQRRKLNKGEMLERRAEPSGKGFKVDKEGRYRIVWPQTVTNENQGKSAVDAALEAIQKEQLPKLKQATEVEYASKKSLDTINSFIELYGKFKEGDINDDELTKLGELEQSLNKEAARYVATGKQRDKFLKANQFMEQFEKRMDESEKIITEYERDRDIAKQRKDKDWETKNADRAEEYKTAKAFVNDTKAKADYQKAISDWEDTQEATLEQVFSYATARQPEVEAIYKGAVRKRSKIANITKAASKDIADQDEYLRQAVKRKDETDEQYKARYDARQKVLEEKQARMAELKNRMRYDEVNSQYDYSTLSDSEAKEFGGLIKTINKLQTVQELYKKINEEKEAGSSFDDDIIDKNEYRKKQEEKRAKGAMSNLHLKGDTAKEYAKIPQISDDATIKQMSSEELMHAAEVMQEAAQQQGEYIDSLSEDYEMIGKMGVAKDIDEERMKIRNLEAAIEKAKAEGQSRNKINNMEKALKASKETLQQLTATSEDDKRIAEEVAQHEIEKKKIQQKLSDINRAENAKSQIKELQKQRDEYVDDGGWGRQIISMDDYLSYNKDQARLGNLDLRTEQEKKLADDLKQQLEGASEQQKQKIQQQLKEITERNAQRNKTVFDDLVRLDKEDYNDILYGDVSKNYSSYTKNIIQKMKDADARDEAILQMIDDKIQMQQQIIDEVGDYSQKDIDELKARQKFEKDQASSKRKQSGVKRLAISEMVQQNIQEYATNRISEIDKAIEEFELSDSEKKVGFPDITKIPKLMDEIAGLEAQKSTASHNEFNNKQVEELMLIRSNIIVGLGDTISQDWENKEREEIARTKEELKAREDALKERKKEFDDMKATGAKPNRTSVKEYNEDARQFKADKAALDERIHQFDLRNDEMAQLDQVENELKMFKGLSGKDSQDLFRLLEIRDEIVRGLASDMDDVTRAEEETELKDVEKQIKEYKRKKPTENIDSLIEKKKKQLQDIYAWFEDEPELQEMEALLEERKQMQQIQQDAQRERMRLLHEQQSGKDISGTKAEGRAKFYADEAKRNVEASRARQQQYSEAAEFFNQEAQIRKQEEEASERLRQQKDADAKAAATEAKERAKQKREEAKMSPEQIIAKADVKYNQKLQKLQEERSKKQEEYDMAAYPSSAETYEQRQRRILEEQKTRLKAIEDEIEKETKKVSKTDNTKSYKSLEDVFKEDDGLQQLVEQRNNAKSILEKAMYDSAKQVEKLQIESDAKSKSEKLTGRIDKMTQRLGKSASFRSIIDTMISQRDKFDEQYSNEEIDALKAIKPQLTTKSRQASAEFTKIDAQVKQKQEEIQKSLLSELETDIQNNINQFIEAINKNSPEDIIIGLKNKILDLYQQYQNYGGTSKFMSAKPDQVDLRDVVSGTTSGMKMTRSGVVVDNSGNIHSIMEFLNNYEDTRIQSLKEEADRLRIEIGAQKNEVENSENSNDSNLQKIQNEIDSLDEQISQHVKNRIDVISSELLRVSGNVGKQKAKELVNTAMDLERSKYGDGAYETAKENKKKLESKLKKTDSNFKRLDKLYGADSAERKSLNDDKQIIQQREDRLKEWRTELDTRRNRLNTAKKPSEEEKRRLLEEIDLADKEQKEIDEAWSSWEKRADEFNKGVRQRTQLKDERVAIQQEIDKNKGVIDAIDKIEQRRASLLQDIKDRGKKTGLLKMDEEEAPSSTSRTEDEIYKELQAAKKQIDELETRKQQISDSLKGIKDQKTDTANKYDYAKNQLLSDKMRKSEKTNIDSIIENLEGGEIDQAKQQLESGGISKKRIGIIQSIISLKETLDGELSQLTELQQQEEDVNAEIAKQKSRADSLRSELTAAQAAVGDTAKQSKIKEDYKKEHPDEQKRKQKDASYDPWKKWYYAEMSEEEAVISRRIHDLSDKAYRGIIKEAESAELERLRKQATSMGLTVTDRGVAPKVEYDEFMAHPEKYVIPKITTEMAKRYGVETRGTISSSIQAVSVSDPINVNTVGSVNSVNLGTIEHLLASIASKLGADISGIKLGAQGAGTKSGGTSGGRYVGKSTKALKKIVNNSENQDEINDAIAEALGRNPYMGLGWNKERKRYFLVQKSNKEKYDEEKTNEWLNEHGITQPKKGQTQKSGGKKSTGTQKEENLRTQLNRIIGNPESTEKEVADAIQKGLESGWMGLTKKNEKGQSFLAKKSGNKYDEETTNAYIKAKNITIPETPLKKEKQQRQDTTFDATQGPRKQELNRILNDAKSTQAEINAAVAEGLSFGWTGIMQDKKTGRPYLVNKSKQEAYDETWEKAYLQKNGITVQAQSATVEAPKVENDTGEEVTIEAINAAYETAVNALNAITEQLQESPNNKDLQKRAQTQQSIVSGLEKKYLESGYVKGDDGKWIEQITNEKETAPYQDVSNKDLIARYKDALEKSKSKVYSKFADQLNAEIEQLSSTLTERGFELKEGEWKKKTGKIAGAEARGYKAYTAEDFEKEEGLAEQVIRSGRSQMGKDNEVGAFWKASVEAAREYIKTVEEAKIATQNIGDQQPDQQVAPAIDNVEQQAEESTTAVIDLEHALESMKSILSSSGEKGLKEALGAIKLEDIKDKILKNSDVGFETKGKLGLKKADMIDYIVGNVSALPKEKSDTTPQLKEETQAAKEDAEAKEKLAEAQDKVADTGAAEGSQHDSNADKMSKEAQDAEQLRKQKAQELADSYTNPEKLQKDINKKQGILDRQVKDPEKRKDYEANLAAMRERLALLQQEAKAEVENAGAAKQDEDAHRNLNVERNQPQQGSAAEANTEDLKVEEAAAQATAEAYEKLRAAAEATKENMFKDGKDVMPSFKNADEAKNVINAMRLAQGEDIINWGNTVNFRTKAGARNFRLSDELGNDFVYKFDEDNGNQLFKTPELENQLTLLTKLESRIQKIKQNATVEDVSKFATNMFPEKDAERIREVQSIWEKIQPSLRNSEGFSLLNEDEIKQYDTDITRMLELVKQLRGQKVGESTVVMEQTGGLATAKADLQAYFDTLDQGNVHLERFSKNNTEMVYTLRTADDMLETHTVSINQYGQMIDTLSQSTKYLSPLEQMISGLGGKFRELLNYFVASTSIYRVVGMLKQGVNVVKEFDTALTEMRKVSDESVASLKNFQQESFSIANTVGTTALQIQQSTADWMRLGETLEEAKESAKDATILLNVSEFSNIDDATESLVALSQAYKSLDKMTIIDKLNKIGNNFSISTSDLAKSLQKSAGTLQVTGDSLDEAIALTVAGNQVLQNPDIVGQSLKTISLRLSGTSVADMQEAGEEIDGLITTQSKLRKKIMDITRVGSNNYQGFDILDERGNYKTTYERLKGIAEVWKEIGEEDKKMGSNRQSLLLETIAGKTRAAAASSILDNFEILEKVYNQSLTSEGSAQEELDKYLDSVAGKLQILSNYGQEFAASVIDSDALKAILDIINNILSAVSKLVKQFGLLTPLIGGVTGIFLSKKGWGVGSGNILSGVKDLGSKIKNGLINVFSRQEFGNEVLDSMFSGMSKSTNLMEVLNKKDVGNLPKTFVDWMNGLGDKRETATLGDALDNVGTHVFDLSGAFSSLGSVALSTLSTLGTMALTVAATWAVGEIVKGIYNLINAEEIAIQKGVEARQAIQDLNERFANKKEYTDENFEEYTELRQGVKISNKDGIENMSLSNDEYKRFLEINNELADLFPSLVTGYDSQGNAILNLSSDANEATNSMSQLLEQERQLADFKVGEQLGDAITGFGVKYNNLKADIEYQDSIIDAAQELQTAIDSSNTKDGGIDWSKLGIDIASHTLDFSFDTDDQSSKELATVIGNVFSDVANNYGGINWSDDEGYLITGHMSATIDENEFFPIDTASFEEALKNRINELELSDIPEEILDAMHIKNKDLAELQADWNGLVPSLLSQLNLYEDYQKIGDLRIGKELQNMMSDSISNLDLSALSLEDWQLFGDHPREFIRKKFLDPIVVALEDEETGEITEESQKLLSRLINFDGSNMTNETYRAEVNKLVKGLTDDVEVQKQIKLILGFTYEDETGKHWDITKRRNELFEQIGGKLDEHGYAIGGQSISWDQFKGLTQSDFEALQYAKDNMGVDLGTINSWEQLLEQIQKAKDEMKETPETKPEDTLSSIFNDEVYKEKAETYEKNLSSLQSALETLRTDGKLTAEAMRDLQEEFPEMTDFSYDNIAKTSQNELEKWIKELTSRWDDMTPKGLKELNTYIQNLAMSYGDLQISADDAKEAMRLSMVTADSTQIDDFRRQTGQYEEMINSLEREYGDELNWEVVWMLALEDRFSDPAANIYAEYDNAVMQWEIQVDMDKTKKEIEKNLQDIAAERSTVEARGSLREAMGLDYTDEDIYDVLTLDDKDIEQYAKAVANTYEEQLKAAQAELAQAQEDYDAAYLARNGEAVTAASQAIVDAQAKIDYIKENKDDIDRDNLEAQANLENAKAKKVQDIITAQERPINKLSNSLNKLQDDAQKTQNELTELENQGMHGTTTQYQNLIDNGDLQLENLERQKELWTNIANSRKAMWGEDSELYTAALQKVTEAEQQMIDIRNNQQQWKQQPLLDYLADKQNEYNDMQTDATEIQEKLTAAETKHQKVSAKTYQDLINNGKKQIDNLKEQKGILQDLQNEVVENSDKWRDYQSQIDSIDSSILSMENDQFGWLESMTSVVSTNAQTLAQTIATAFSEMNSETGLSIETMNELQKQFSDLAGRDVSGIFYQSADGMKMNVDAARDLIDAEYELQTNNLYDAIAEQKSIIDELSNSEDVEAQAAVTAANYRIDAYNRELAMLQALYDQQQASISGYQKWQTAQSTANAGEHYESLQGYLKTQKENYDKGLTGTDEFGAYTEYFSQWGLDTVAEWERVRDQVERYLTDDINGYMNFLEDLYQNGLATKDENGVYTMNASDKDAAAAAMGMSTEWFSDMLKRGEDYGAINYWVQSEADGMLQLQEQTEKLTEVTLKLNKARAEGADPSVIQNLEDYQNEILNNIDNIQHATDVVTEHQGEISSTQIQGAISQIKDLQDLITDDMNEGQKDIIENQIQQIADANHVILKVDAETGELTVDTEAMEDAFPDYNIPVTVTPNWDVDTEGKSEEYTNVFEKVQGGWDENNTALQGYLDTLSGFSQEDLEKITLSDNQYNVEGNLMQAEDALQGIADMFGLSAEEGTQLLQILRDIGAFDGVNGENWYKVNAGGLGVSALNASQYLDKNRVMIGSENDQHRVTSEDLNFDAANMTLGEMQEKIYDLNETAKQMNMPGAEQAKQEIEDVVAALQKQYELKIDTEALKDENGNAIYQPNKETGYMAPVTKEQFVQDEGLQNQLRKTVYVDMEDDEYTKFVETVKNEVLVSHVETVLQQSGTSLEEASQMTDEQLVNIGFQAEGLDEIKSTIDAMATEASTITIRIADDQMDALLGKTQEAEMTIDANNKPAKDKADEAETYAKNKKPTMQILGDSTGAMTSANNAYLQINNMSPSLKIKADMNNFAQSIRTALAGMTFTVNAKVNAHKYTGTMLSPAKASGTAYNTLNMIPAKNAFADGKVGLDKDETALVNELGTESIVRDGMWYLLPGGMHVEQLKKGDIVLNHLQTEDLIKHGQALGKGKAYAQGSGVPLSSIPMMSAHVTSGGSKFGGGSSVKQKDTTTKATNNNNKATNGNTAAKNKNTKSTKKATTALDKFKKWLEKFVDWIDNRVDVLTKKIDRFEKTAELATNALGKLGKNSNIQNAMNTIADIGTYKNANLTMTKVTGSNGVTANIAKSASGGTKGTLLYDTMRGAVRYQQFADSIMTEAVNRGLFGKVKTKKQKEAATAQANNIKKLIQTGEIDIKKYNEKIRQVIQSYEEWYGKSQDLIDKTYELKQQFKDLEQTKLDNITEQADVLQKYAESLQGISDSYIKLNTINGQKAVNDPRFKREYDSQIQQQNFITGYLKGEAKAFQNELIQAAQVFGVNSNEYHEALTKFNEMQQAIYDSEAKYYELRKQQAETEFNNISQIMDRIKDIQSLINARISLNQARDNRYLYSESIDPDEFEEMYKGLLATNNGLIEQYKAQWDEAVKYMGENQLQINNEEYQEYYKRAIEAETEIENLLANQEEIKKNIRDIRWKSFEQLQEQIKNTIADFDHLSDLMRDAEFFDWEFGINITDKGYANLSLLAKNIERAKQQIKDYRKALEKLNEEVHNGNITETEYNEKSREFVDIIQDAAKAVIGYEDSIIDMYKSQIQAENDLLQQNISKRKEALSAKKAYYDYDKTLKGQTKDVTQLQAQIAALSGSTNQAARAELAKLQAQLKEAQDTLADTRYEHEIEMQQQGYDKLSEDANKILEDTLKQIDADQAVRDDTIRYELSLLNGHATEAKDAITGVINSTDTVISGTAKSQLNEALSTNGKLDQLITDAQDKQWKNGISSEITDLKTEQIKTWNENTASIEEAIEKDFKTLIKPLIEANNVDISGIDTNLQTIKDAFVQFKDAYDAAQAKKTQDEGNGENGYENNEPPKPDDNGTSIAEQQKLIDAINANGEEQKKINDQRNAASNQLSNARNNETAKQTAYEKAYTAWKKAEDRYKANKTSKNKKAAQSAANAVGKALDAYNAAQDATKRAEDLLKELDAQLREKELQMQELEREKVLKGYAKGSRRTKDELNWLHDSEVVIRKSDGAILQPFNAGDMVFTSKQSENLWKMSQIPIEQIQAMVRNTDMSKFTTPGIRKEFSGMTSGGNVQEIHFDSLITINGNATQETVDKIEQIAQALMQNRNFKSNLTNIVTKDLARESKKAGYRY